jgi:cytochrome c oxidase subunit 2
VWLLFLAFAGCGGAQSTLAPAGRGAERIASLFWWMTAGSIVIWAGFMALTVYAVYFSREPKGVRGVRRLIVAGGVALPSVVLAGLLTWSLATMPGLLEPAPAGALELHVTGEQWWWRVRYLSPGREPVALANELHFPVNEPVEIRLDSPDVIHSFWIPALGGKTDMIPGRQTRLRLEPTRSGVYRGTCAEYCGASHAFMSFPVVVEEREAFDRWLAAQAAPARSPDTPVAVRGRDVFFESGCGACHAVRGTHAKGVIGPDLTHVGGRRTVGAGRLDNGADALRRFVTHTAQLKPGVLMPAFGMLPRDDLIALATYLESLK